MFFFRVNLGKKFEFFRKSKNMSILCVGGKNHTKNLEIYA